MRVKGQKIEPVGWCKGRPTYKAKIGTHGSSCVIVRHVRKFRIGQRIKFINERDFVSVATKWEPGIISDISDDRLFINKH